MKMERFVCKQKVSRLPSLQDRGGGICPYWAEFSQDRKIEPLPKFFTATVEAAWRVGGVVLDAGGNAVVGAEHPIVLQRARSRC